jgi:hypothetical protein
VSQQKKREVDALVQRRVPIPAFIEKIRERDGKTWRESCGGKNMAGERWREIRAGKCLEIAGGRYHPENICERERNPY